MSNPLPLLNTSVASGQYGGSYSLAYDGKLAHSSAPLSATEGRESLFARPLVVVGSANVDYVWRVSRMPTLGETMDAESLTVFPGGKV